MIQVAEFHANSLKKLIRAFLSKYFIGKENLITPWWDKDAAKIPLSCIFLFGWPFRMAYNGRIAKHQVRPLSVLPSNSLKIWVKMTFFCLIAFESMFDQYILKLYVKCRLLIGCLGLIL